ncbi:AraC family transcriptional regulator [Mycobacterium sp. E796]|uniref:AraC family transcriptional regulator n=1 Tax=Mycobacterium sp. E796 TaxID=1834151 RepID=UPI000800ED7C|nr:AraC family transcriptional regulator [Mycobacterium sp. E796]OBI70532.1 hypothetical protein A5706_09830 [Mycobacterium sp. E796]
MAAIKRWDIRAVLSTAGIAPASVHRACPAITPEMAAAVLRQLWAMTNDMFLGLGPHPVSRDTVRVLAFAISSAPTLGSALTRLEQFAPLFAGLPAPVVCSAGGRTTLSLRLDEFDDTLSLVADSILMVAHRVINWATRRQVDLERVDVTYQRPRGETDHDLIFGAPTYFGMQCNALTFPTNVLTAPVVRRQEEIEQFLTDIPSTLLSEFEFNASHALRVRTMIERCLGHHVCSADEIATAMGISRQTLRRRLQEENTSVSAIRDDVLHKAARDSLAQGGETVSALAGRLGFSEPSAFTRAFRRWTGESPSAFLRRHVAIA